MRTEGGYIIHEDPTPEQKSRLDEIQALNELLGETPLHPNCTERALEDARKRALVRRAELLAHAEADKAARAAGREGPQQSEIQSLIPRMLLKLRMALPGHGGLPSAVVQAQRDLEAAQANLAEAEEKAQAKARAEQELESQRAARKVLADKIDRAMARFAEYREFIKHPKALRVAMTLLEDWTSTHGSSVTVKALDDYSDATDVERLMSDLPAVEKYYAARLKAVDEDIAKFIKANNL